MTRGVKPRHDVSLSDLVSLVYSSSPWWNILSICPRRRAVVIEAESKRSCHVSLSNAVDAATPGFVHALSGGRSGTKLALYAVGGPTLYFDQEGNAADASGAKSGR